VKVKLHSDVNWPDPDSMRPAVDVKTHGCMGDWPTAEEITERFGCSLKTAEKCSEWAFEYLQAEFWEVQADYLVRDVFGEGAKFHSEGRSAGWLVVDSGPLYDSGEVLTWDEKMQDRWSVFETAVESCIHDNCSRAEVFEVIFDMEWAMDVPALDNMMVEGLARLIVTKDLEARALDTSWTRAPSQTASERAGSDPGAF
jgi:hypothetical protein